MMNRRNTSKASATLFPVVPSIETNYLVTRITLPVVRSSQRGSDFNGSGLRKLRKEPRCRQPVASVPSMSQAPVEKCHLVSTLIGYKRSIEVHRETGRGVQLWINGEQRLVKKERRTQSSVTFNDQSNVIWIDKHESNKYNFDFSREIPQLQPRNNRMMQPRRAPSISNFQTLKPIAQVSGTRSPVKPILTNSTKRSNKVFQRLLYWCSEFSITLPETSSDLHFQKQNKPLSLKKVGEALGLKIQDITSLNVFKDKIKDSGNAIISDLYKHMAFTAYQRQEMDKSVYLLSLSHGNLLRAEMLDKQQIYQSRKEEYPNTMLEITATKSRFYSHNLTTYKEFGSSIGDFEQKINELHPSWNIIQLSTMPVHDNGKFRFGSEHQKFPLFLTCYFTIPMLQKRVSYVTYIPYPNADMQSEFLELMHQNRTINSTLAKGSSKVYWAARMEQNRNLREFIRKMERNWISPFNFLFPGRLGAEATTESLWRTVETLGTEYNLSHAKWILLYKLMENYCVLDVATQAEFKKFVKILLNISKKDAHVIAKRIQKVARNVVTGMARYPTILVLDHDIEEYPWDWMECLRYTDVSRMPSLAAIYSAYHVAPRLISKYPGFVNPKRCGFILNPDASLPNTQQRLEPYFRSRAEWDGPSGRQPADVEYNYVLEHKDIFIYSGHGNSFGVIPEYAVSRSLCRNAIILMGCGSLKPRKAFHRSLVENAAYTYTAAGCPCIVGFLWEVTDVECDRVTVELLEHWVPGPGPIPEIPAYDSRTRRPKVAGLVNAARRARLGATQFLTEAGLVCYGLPIFTRQRAPTVSQSQFRIRI